MTDHRPENDETPTVAEFDTYAVEVEWDRPSPDSPKLPDLIGPFPRREEAHEWAALNIPNGSWEVRPLAWPYYRSGGNHA